MTLNEHAFYEAMRGDELKHYPGKYAEIAYSIKELCTELEKFVASKSPTDGSCGDRRRWSRVVVVRVSAGVGGRGHRWAWAWAWARWRALAHTVI